MSAPQNRRPGGTPHRKPPSLLWPALVTLLAAVVAVVAWLSTRDDGEDTTAEPPDPATTSGTAEAPEGSTEDPAGDATEPPPEEVAGLGEPLEIGGVEVTPPPAGEFAFPTGSEESWTAPLEERGAGGPYSLGEEDAPVVMLMYSEFQCPYCREFATTTMPELMPYVEDGTLRVQWRDFPYLGPESSLAALGGRTAAEQGKFWEFHDELFAREHSPNTGAFTEESLAEMAEAAGLDRATFEASLNSAEQQEEMVNDQEEGVALGVAGTPSFLVNGIPIRGAQPTEVFIRAIEDAAAAREG